MSGWSILAYFITNVVLGGAFIVLLFILDGAGALDTLPNWVSGFGGIVAGVFVITASFLVVDRVETYRSRKGGR